MSARHILLAGSCAAAALLVSPACFAADLHAEITIAAQHASLAAQANDPMVVRMHLHHALNCLEGPKGADFTAKEIDPCANAGSGAIPDSSDSTTSAALELAITQAVQGLSAPSLATAQSDANAAAATLKGIK
jgi:hypothetical protein